MNLPKVGRPTSGVQSQQLASWSHLLCLLHLNLQRTLFFTLDCSPVRDLVSSLSFENH